MVEIVHAFKLITFCLVSMLAGIGLLYLAQLAQILGAIGNY